MDREPVEPAGETPSCMGNSPPTSSAGRRLEQAIAAAIATCAPFVALCVGEAAPRPR